MNNNLGQVFKNISQLEPPQDLGDSILARIESKKENKIKTNLFLSYAGLAVSFLLILGTASVFGNSFLKSEFWSIASLTFSDFLVVAGSWQEFGYSLMETFPIMAVITVLTPIFLFLLFFSLLLSFKNKYRYIHNHFNLYKNNLAV